MAKKLIFKKIVNPIKTEYGNVYINIELEEEGNKIILSLNGVEAPTRDGNCKGSAVQLHDVLLQKDVEIKEGWDQEKIDKLYKIWRDYHLNDMRAGSPLQQKAIREKYGYNYPSYDAVCEYLKTIDLYVDKTQNNYKYGYAWLYEEIPENVIDFLKSLPNSKTKPAWI